MKKKKNMDTERDCVVRTKNGKGRTQIFGDNCGIYNGCTWRILERWTHEPFVEWWVREIEDERTREGWGWRDWFKHRVKEVGGGGGGGEMFKNVY